MSKAKKRVSFLSRALRRLRRKRVPGKPQPKRRRAGANSMRQRMARQEALSESLGRSVEWLAREAKATHVAKADVSRADVEELRELVHDEIAALRKEIAAMRIQAATPQRTLSA